MTIEYDASKFEVVSVSNKVPGGFATCNKTDAGYLRVMSTKQGSNTLTLNGVCDVITFRVKSSAAKGESPLTVRLRDSADSVYRVDESLFNFIEVDSSFVAGSITVK